MVTQQSWMFLKSFEPIRQDLLRTVSFITVAHLGPGAFEEIGGVVVSVAAFVIQLGAPHEDHRCVAFRLVGLQSARDRASALADKAGKGSIFYLDQSRLNRIPEAPFAYWLRPTFLSLLSSSSLLADLASVRQGMSTGDNDRFVRCLWEVCDPRPSGSWIGFAKGGAYARWAGLETHVVFWADRGAAIKGSGRAAVRVPTGS